MPSDPSRRAAPAPRAALGVLAALCLVSLAAPLIAGDRPIAAIVDGRLVFPALAGQGGDPAAPVTTRVLLRPPVPYGSSGIRLDEALAPPGRRHLFGTDILGRDLLARMIHGTRVSVFIGLGATAVALAIGMLLGGLAGVRGGAVDHLVVRLIDVFASFPPFILALAVVTAAGHGGTIPVVIGIALNRWTSTARYVRGEMLRLRDGDLWSAARAAGASGPRVVARHMLPLFLAPLLVMASFSVAHAIVVESGLSFLGLGVQPPVPSWGALLAEARGTLGAAWWPVVFPSLALLLTLGALCLAAERAGASGGGRATPL